MSNIHIEDSYKISKHSFKAVLATKQDAEAQEVKAHRCYYSLLCEWLVHSFLAHWGIAVERTKDVDLDSPFDGSHLKVGTEIKENRI